MAKPDVLVLANNIPLIQDELPSFCTVHNLFEQSDKDAFLAENKERFQAIVTSYNVGAKEELMGALPNLKIICCFGVGVDAIDLEKAKELGVPVTNTPGVLTDDTADTALTLLLTTLRKACAADRFVRAKSWTKSAFPLATSLSVGGKKAGIVGLGDIGKAVAKRIEAFGTTIYYQGPREKPEVPYKYFSTVEALAKEVDFLVLTCPGGAATYRIVNRTVLDALGPNGFVINVARGSVVDEGELVKALVEKRIAGAGLDVFESEPNVPEELLSMDNVVVFPHIGSATIETRSNMARLMMQNLQAHFEGKELPTPVK